MVFSGLSYTFRVIQYAEQDEYGFLDYILNFSHTCGAKNQ